MIETETVASDLQVFQFLFEYVLSESIRIHIIVLLYMEVTGPTDTVAELAGFFAYA